MCEPFPSAEVRVGTARESNRAIRDARADRSATTASSSARDPAAEPGSESIVSAAAQPIVSLQGLTVPSNAPGSSIPALRPATASTEWYPQTASPTASETTSCSLPNLMAYMVPMVHPPRTIAGDPAHFLL